jgi:hypothetical protein
MQEIADPSDSKSGETALERRSYAAKYGNRPIQPPDSHRRSNRESEQGGLQHDNQGSAADQYRDQEHCSEEQ